MWNFLSNPPISTTAPLKFWHARFFSSHTTMINVLPMSLKGALIYYHDKQRNMPSIFVIIIPGKRTAVSLPNRNCDSIFVTGQNPCVAWVWEECPSRRHTGLSNFVSHKEVFWERLIKHVPTKCPIYLLFIFYVIHLSNLGHGQSNHLFADDFFKFISFNRDVCSWIQISLNFVSKGPAVDNSRLVQVMAWPR